MNFKNETTVDLKLKSMYGGGEGKEVFFFFFHSRYTSEAMGSSGVDIKVVEPNDRSTARLNKNKFNARQEISETPTPNDEYENFVNAHLEVAAECISTKQKVKPSPMEDISG